MYDLLKKKAINEIQRIAWEQPTAIICDVVQQIGEFVLIQRELIFH